MGNDRRSRGDREAGEETEHRVGLVPRARDRDVPRVRRAPAERAHAAADRGRSRPARVERIAGEPLATKRRPDATLPIRDDRRADRGARSVRDATARRSWCRCRRCARCASGCSKIRATRAGSATACGCAAAAACSTRSSRATSTQALANAPTAPNHGDLLLRNVIGDDEDDLVLVDWECAGTHLRDWDLALLWTQLAGPGRGIVEDAVRESGARWRAFLGLVRVRVRARAAVPRRVSRTVRCRARGRRRARRRREALRPSVNPVALARGPREYSRPDVSRDLLRPRRHAVRSDSGAPAMGRRARRRARRRCARLGDRARRSRAAAAPACSRPG